MPVENLPHWTILPNWRTPVMERLECLTVVLGSPSGAEQRYAARWSPRRMFEPLVTPIGPVRTLFDMAVGSVGASPWYLPLWHDVQITTETLGIGDTTLNCETLHREFKAGGFVMLWADEFRSEVLEVASVSSGALAFVAGPVVSWPAGTKLFPAVKARLTDMPEMSRRGPIAIENSLRFMVETENDFVDPDVTLPFPTYAGFLVLTTHPDESQDITHGRIRMLEELDSETGLSRRYDSAGLDFTLQRHHWLNLGRQEHAELRTLFYTLDGRRNLMWVPTFANDLEVVDAALAGDTNIKVRLCGFTAFGGPRFSRDRIWIKLRDGTDLYREITGSSLTGSDKETIQLDAALGVAFGPEDVARVSFMALCRLDSDTMEIEHYTNTDGAARVALTFRSAPNTRTGGTWDVPALPNATPNDLECGAVGCTSSSYPITMDNRYVMLNAGTDGGLGLPANSSEGAYIMSQTEIEDSATPPENFTYVTTVPAAGEITIVATRVGPTSPSTYYPFITKGTPDLVPNGHPLIADSVIRCRLNISHTGSANYIVRFQLFDIDGSLPSTTIEDAFTGAYNYDLFTTTTVRTSSDLFEIVWDGVSMNLWANGVDQGPYTNGSLISSTFVAGVYNFGATYPCIHYGVLPVDYPSFDVSTGSLEVTVEITDLEYAYTCP